jgi:hypothetical protein
MDVNLKFYFSFVKIEINIGIPEFYKFRFEEYKIHVRQCETSSTH